MRLLGQFQVCLSFFTKKFWAYEMHQNAKQTTFTLKFLCAQKIVVVFLFAYFHFVGWFFLVTCFCTLKKSKQT